VSGLKLAPPVFRLQTESAFELLERANNLSKSGRDIINQGIGQPDFLTPPNIVEEGIKALKDGHHGYTSSNGLLELREAVAENLKNRHSVFVDPNNVIITLWR